MARPRLFRQMFFDCFRSVPAARHYPSPETWADDRITGSCLGHSTVLLNFLGTWLLTDPVFSMRVGIKVGPVVLGPKRYLRPALTLSSVPKLDLILLSHAHFDHLDLPSLRQFPRETVVVTAKGTADLLRHFHTVHELAWGETITLPGEITITALEVNHWGARVIRDEHRGYNGYLLEKSGRSVCFAGDTAQTDVFAQVRSKNAALDLILMPIAAYDPWIRAHCTPEEAAAMAEDAGARYFVPTHHETFKLSAEPMTEPAERIQRVFRKEPGRLLALHVGETFRLPLD